MAPAPKSPRRLGRRRLFALRALRVVAVVGGLLCVGGEIAVREVAHGRVFASADGLPPSDVALVLGTSPALGDGRPNVFYTARLDLAAELFRCGKVRGVIVSGDNSRSDYNEPDAMKADLVARGVPEKFITCDYAGFSTLDSMKRASRVFGQQRVTVVSQRFHAERAVFLARCDGLDAVGCAASAAPRWWQVRVRLREVLARGKAVLDVAAGSRAKFLGPREPVALAGAD